MQLFHNNNNFIKGSFRVINGRDAELICEFPRGQHLISNIVWEKVDNRTPTATAGRWNSFANSFLNPGSFRSRSLRDYLGRRMEV